MGLHCLVSSNDLRAVLRSKQDKTLSDLYVRPRNLSTGSFHRSLKSPAGNSDETFALAIDQLRVLRNVFSHPSSSELDKLTFDLYLKLAKDAFDALGVSTDGIDSISRAHDLIPSPPSAFFFF